MSATRETAVQLDAAIDALLRGPVGPRPGAEGELVATARLLRDALPRLHPRFGFDDLLAARLAAARRALVTAATPVATPTPIRPDLGTDDMPDMPGETGERRRRGLVAGGAIASGVSLALPIAGAALVVWRRSRSSGGIL